MKKNLLKYLYVFCQTVVVKVIHESETRLTPEYLLAKGWVREKEHTYFKKDTRFYFVEPNIKERDKISILFTENNAYRVYHGKDKTFIAAESSVEWFEMYYLIIHPDNRYQYLNT